ncbi:MAG: hypothetical protein HWE21_05220 [Cytophagia bacterium]|nr:hypothetical protein [Cytophagia bacterium]
MSNTFKNLKSTLNLFSEEYDLTLDQNLGSLELSIKEGYIDGTQLKKEIQEAINDPNFQWLDFAIENRFVVHNQAKYDNESVKRYFLSLVGEYLKLDYKD